MFQIVSLPIYVEARVGIALYPDHGDTADLLWQRADIALQQTPDSPGAPTTYNTEIDSFDPKRLALIGELRNSIDANELVLFWQPKVDIKTKSTIGMEALIRWQHPDQGLIYPDSFIPFIEHTGLIHPLTTWVIKNALAQGKIWCDLGFRLQISINISARNLLDPTLTTSILDELQLSGFPIDLLTIEVTESAIMHDPKKGQAMLAEMKKSGIRLSMDDFGTGQSSLTYLKDLPLSEMKIDKSFVIDYEQPRNAAIVHAAVTLGQNLGLKVTAEGVENEATLDALAKINCEIAQGYFISRPMEAENIVDWLNTSAWPYQRKKAIKLDISR